MCYVQGIHVSHLVMQATEKEITMKEQYLSTLPTPLAFYDPETCCWRMSQDTLLSERPPSLQYLPNFGTTQNGALYELPTPAHLTSARGYLSGAKLKTPTASENVKPRPHRVDGDRYDLADQLGKLLNGDSTEQRLDAGKQLWDE